MTLLLWLTIGYAAVLVLVLAVGLILVWLRLRAIDRALEATRDALVRASDASGDLDDRVAPLRERLLSAFAALQEAGDDLSEADERIREREGADLAGSAS